MLRAETLGARALVEDTHEAIRISYGFGAASLTAPTSCPTVSKEGSPEPPPAATQSSGPLAPDPIPFRADRVPRFSQASSPERRADCLGLAVAAFHNAGPLAAEREGAQASDESRYAPGAQNFLMTALCAGITSPTTSHTSADPVPDVEDKAEDHKDPSPTATPGAFLTEGWVQ
jgi:hypothetical protein